MRSPLPVLTAFTVTAALVGGCSAAAGVPVPRAVLASAPVPAGCAAVLAALPAAAPATAAGASRDATLIGKAEQQAKGTTAGRDAAGLVVGMSLAALLPASAAIPAADQQAWARAFQAVRSYCEG